MLDAERGFGEPAQCRRIGRQLTLNVQCRAIVAKAQFLAAATAACRGKLKAFINPEDAACLGGSHVESDEPPAQRIGRTHRNDLEALLPFAIVRALYLLSGASLLAGDIHFGLFVLARLVLTVAYLSRYAATRRDAFTFACALIFVIGAHALAVLFPQLIVS